MLAPLDESYRELKSATDPYVRARLLDQINKEHQIRIKDLAKYLQKSSSYICNLIRIMKVPETVRDGFYTKNLTLSHLFVISRLKNPEDMIDLYERILTESLTVLEVEEAVREKIYEVGTGGIRTDKDTKDLIAKKIKQIDAEVQIKIIQTRIKAKLEVSLRGGTDKTSEFLKKLSKML